MSFGKRLQSFLIKISELGWSRSKICLLFIRALAGMPRAGGATGWFPVCQVVVAYSEGVGDIFLTYRSARVCSNQAVVKKLVTGNPLSGFFELTDFAHVLTRFGVLFRKFGF